MFKRKPKQRMPKATAQQSGPTYSYYSNAARSDDKTANRQANIDNLRLKSHSKWWHNAPSILATAAIVISLLYALGLNSNPIIIQTAGSKNVFLQTNNTYSQSAHKLFNQSLLNKNKITVNVNGITSQLKQQFPELSNVTITLPIFSHQPLIYIVPSQPSVIINGKNGKYILNDSGIAVLPLSKAKNVLELKLPTVDDRSNLTIIPGRAALTSGNVSFITIVYAQLLVQKQSVKELSLPLLANELDLQLAGKNYIIKMDMQSSAKEQVGTLLATIKHLDAGGQTPSTYIDVRVSGRAYYK